MSHEPPPGGPSGLEVISSATGATSRIGMFPDAAFAASSPAEARRFFLPSAGGDRAATECFTVELGGEGGAATVMLKVSPPFAN